MACYNYELTSETNIFIFGNIPFMGIGSSQGLYLHRLKSHHWCVQNVKYLVRLLCHMCYAKHVRKRENIICTHALLRFDISAAIYL
jgi:hypothetical protein